MEPQTDASDFYAHQPLAQPMVATPVDFALGNQLGMAQQAVNAGTSTDMHEQTAHAIEQATRLADMMASKGATDEEIKRAVGNVAGVNSDNHAAVQAAAMNTADAHKFSILGGAAKNDGQGQQATGNTLMEMLGAGKAESPYVLTDEQRRNQPVTTEQALAAMGADIPKTPGLPGQQRQQSVGRG